MQYIERQSHWRAVEWQYRMSDGQLEHHGKELNEAAQLAGDRQDWDRYNDCKNALFIVRSEQRRREDRGNNSAS